MQKLQYQQEKKLLKQKTELLKNKPEEADLKKEASIEEFETDIEIEQDAISVNEANTTKDQSSISNLITTNRTQTTARTKQDSFSMKMEERQKLREQMRKEREEKKRKLEIEKLELLKAQQEEKLRMEEEEKQKRAEEIKEKRKIQKELEEKRNSEKIKEQNGMIKADSFYRKYLLNYYCMTGLKKLIEIKNNQMNKAIRHYRKCLFNKIIIEWKEIINIELERKQAIADLFNQKRVVKHCFQNGLKQFKQCIQIESAKASRFYKYHIKFKLFEAWKIYKTNEKEKFINYEILIIEHNLSRIRFKYFKIWKEFPNEQRRVKQRQKRLNELRSKVREMIPDYEGPETLNNNFLEENSFK